MYTPPLPRPNFSHSDRNHIVDPPDGSPLRVYQVWKGRNKFICGGRLIFGPDVKSIFLTLSMIVVPVILFWSFVARELTEALPHPRGILILVLSIILIAHIIVLLLVTSGSDPGIIPRNSRPPEPDDCDTSSLSTDWASSQISQPGMPMTKNVTINGIIVKVKYCQTCMLYRPPRCSHCSICNNCVERFDHHCPWVGQCIGKRNYRYFFMFVSSTSLLCLYVLVCSLINITRIMNKYDVTFWRAIQKSPVSGILVMYTFVISWFVGGLTMFHVYLISTNQTTYENFRYQYDRRMNPYNLGFPSNCKEVFCSKIPSSKNDFRAMTKGDPSFGFSASSYSSQAIRQDKPIRSFDLEIGKRQGVVDGDDARNRVASFGKLERCSTEPRRNDWSQSIEWGVSPDKSMYTPEFGRNRIQGREDNDDRSPEFGRNRIQGREDNDDR